MFWVYMLRCADNSYYVGHTDDLENRVEQHRLKIYPTCYTATRLPIKLVFSQEFAAREDALASERQIKRWSRKKKEALIVAIGIGYQLAAKEEKNLNKDAPRDAALHKKRSVQPSGRTVCIFIRIKFVGITQPG